jgi:hypothetical protein
VHVVAVDQPLAPLIVGFSFREHCPEIVPQFDPDAVPAHDDALLNDRKGMFHVQ